MNENPTITAIEIPLHILLRRRRQELKLVQSKVAEALHVSPECVTLWEAGAAAWISPSSRASP